jgi:hypothetical protein
MADMTINGAYKPSAAGGSSGAHHRHHHHHHAAGTSGLMSGTFPISGGPTGVTGPQSWTA